MVQDIFFQTEDLLFSYRAAGVLIQNDHILLQKPADDDYALPGGHVCRNETSEDAVKREYWEEVGVRVELEQLMAVGEVFFHWNGRLCQQIGLYYRLRLCEGENIPLTGVVPGCEPDRGITFRWVPLDELRRGLKVYPEELIPYILEECGDVVHFVSREA